MTAATDVRVCAYCADSLEGRRPGTIYCTRTCKNNASSKRRLARDPDYDRRRYATTEGDSRRAGARRYYYENRDQQVLYTRNYKHAGRDRADGSIPITLKEWTRLKARHHNACAYCQTPQAVSPLHMDHVVPLSRGGRHVPSNILPVCDPCNMSKRRSFLTEWRLLLARGGKPHPYAYTNV